MVDPEKRRSRKVVVNAKYLATAWSTVTSHIRTYGQICGHFSGLGVFRQVDDACFQNWVVGSHSWPMWERATQPIRHEALLPVSPPTDAETRGSCPVFPVQMWRRRESMPGASMLYDACRRKAAGRHYFYDNRDRKCFGPRVSVSRLCPESADRTVATFWR